MKRRDMAYRPLVVLPGGYPVYESDIRRIRIGRKARAFVEFVVFTAILIGVALGASLVDPVAL